MIVLSEDSDTTFLCQLDRPNTTVRSTNRLRKSKTEEGPDIHGISQNEMYIFLCKNSVLDVLFFLTPLVPDEHVCHHVKTHKIKILTGIQTPMIAQPGTEALDNDRDTKQENTFISTETTVDPRRDYKDCRRITSICRQITAPRQRWGSRPPAWAIRRCIRRAWSTRNQARR